MPLPPPPPAFPDATLIARGGMGAVYRCTDAALRRPVAVKVALGPPADPAWARLEREARALAAVAGPGVPAVHRLGADETGRPFVVMDLVEGEDLQARLAACRDAAARHALLPRVRAAARVLGRAHRLGVVHRDATARNLRVDARGATWVLDWGLASAPATGAADPLRTRAGARLGTPRAMSPEQAAGAAVDARADVWALGILLYEVLAGRPAYPGETAEAVLPAILRGPPDPAPLAAAPAALRAVVGRALAPLDARLPDADAFADALDAALSPAPRRRWPRALAAVAAALGGLALGHALTPAAPVPPEVDATALTAAAFSTAEQGRPGAAAHLALAALEAGGPAALRGLLLVPDDAPTLLGDAPGPACAIGEVLSPDGAWLFCAQVDATEGWRVAEGPPTRAWTQPVEVHQIQPAGPEHMVGQAPAIGALVRLDRRTGAPAPQRVRALAQGPLHASAHPGVLLGGSPRLRVEDAEHLDATPAPCPGAPALVRADGTEAWACPEALVLQPAGGPPSRTALPADAGRPVRLVEAPDGGALGVLTDRGRVGVFRADEPAWWSTTHGAPASALALSAGGARYAVGGVFGAVVGGAREGAGSWTIPGRSYHLAFPGPDQLVQVAPGRVRRWRVPAPPPDRHPPAPIRALAWTPGGLVAALDDGSVRRWPEPGAPADVEAPGHAFAARPDGALAIADDSAVQDRRGRRVATDPPCRRLAWLDDDRLLCAPSGPGPLVVDLAAGTVDRRHVQPNTRWVSASARDGQAAVLEWSARVWSLEADPGAPLVPRGRHPWTSTLAQGPGGRIALSDRLSVRILDPGADTPTATWPTRSRVRTMAWSPDGRRLAVLGYMDMAHVFDAASGAELARLPAGEGARALAFSPDGATLAIGGRQLRRIPLGSLEAPRSTLQAGVLARWGDAGGSLGP